MIFLQGKGTFAKPFDSTQGIPDYAVMPIFWIAVFFILFIVIRVWISLRKDNHLKKKNLPKE